MGDVVKLNRATILVPCTGTDAFLKSIYEDFKKDIPKGFTNYQYKGGQLNLPLPPDSPALEEVIEMLRSQKISVDLFSEMHYTKKELDNLPFFQMCIAVPLELEGVHADYFGTRYEGRCPNCDFGGTPIGNILVDRKFVKKCKIGWLYPNIVVSREVRDFIESNELTGVSFGERVLDYKGREIPELYVMNVHHVLPPMSESTWLVKSGVARYQKCGHDVVYLRSDIQYEKEKLDGALDFNLTAEFVDNYRSPELVVSARAKKLFKEHRIFSFFRPITLL